jgi:hypothetical protein
LSFFAIKLSNGKYVAFNNAYVRVNECFSPLETMIAGFPNKNAAFELLNQSRSNDSLSYYSNAKVLLIEKTFTETVQSEYEQGYADF